MIYEFEIYTIPYMCQFVKDCEELLAELCQVKSPVVFMKLVEVNSLFNHFYVLG